MALSGHSDTRRDVRFLPEADSTSPVIECWTVMVILV